MRLARYGYRTLILDSVTLEEANSDVINWIRQRSRWYKGYLQTMIVHMRRPLQLRRDIGLKAMLRLINLTVPYRSRTRSTSCCGRRCWCGSSRAPPDHPDVPPGHLLHVPGLY